MTAEVLEERASRAMVNRVFRHVPWDVQRALRQTDDRSVAGIREKWHPPGQKYNAVMPAPHRDNPTPANGIGISEKPTVDQPFMDTVTIRMFDPNQIPQLASLAQEIFGPEIRSLAAQSDPKALLHEEQRRLRFHSDEAAEEYNRRRNKQRAKTKKLINRNALHYVQTELGAHSQREALAVFQHHAAQADNAVKYHAAQLYPQDAMPKIPAIVARATTPAGLAATYFSSDPEVRFAAQRKMLLTLTSMQLEREGRKGADKKLEQIKKLLEKELFESGPHAAKNAEIFVVADDETNEAIVLDEQPTEPAPQGHHYKKITYRDMRRIKGTNIDGMLMIGKKGNDSAESKTIFKAKKRADKGESDDIRPEDVDDSHRMMVVVKGNDNDAERVRQMISFMLMGNDEFLCDKDAQDKPMHDREGHLLGTVTDVNPKDTTQKTNGSAEKLGHKRVIVKFAGYDMQFEIIVKSTERDINYYREIGIQDQETGINDGLAHDPFKIQKRAPTVDTVMYPDEIYPGLVRPYRRLPDGTFPPHPVLEEIIYDLRHADRYEPEVVEALT